MTDTRKRFEHWYSDGGAAPRAIERNGDDYLLMQAHQAWTVWQAAELALAAADANALTTNALVAQKTGNVDDKRELTIIDLSDALDIIDRYPESPEFGMQKAHEFLLARSKRA